jgi:predicted PurR-regulated permease PerM
MEKAKAIYLIIYIIAIFAFLLFAFFLFRMYVPKNEEVEAKLKEYRAGKIIISIVCVGMISASLFIGIIPITRDIKNIIQNNYEQATVIALSNGRPSSSDGGGSGTSMTVENIETGEKFVFQYYGSMRVDKGTVLVIEYYPNLKAGRIVEILEEPKL